MLKSGKQIWDKYQFTFGKGASFKVRVHDFSPSFLPFAGSSWRTGRGRTLDLPPHLLFLLLSFRCRGSLFWLGVLVHPRVLALHCLVGSWSAALPSSWTWKTYPPFRHGNGFLPFRHRSLPWQTLEKVVQVRGRLRGNPPYPLPQSRQGRRSLVLVRKCVQLSLRDIEWLNLQAVRA